MRVKPVIGALLLGSGGLGSAMAPHSSLTREHKGRAPLTCSRSEPTVNKSFGRSSGTSVLANVATDTQVTAGAVIINRHRIGSSRVNGRPTTRGATRTITRPVPRPWWVDRKLVSSSDSDSDSSNDSDTIDSSEDNNWPAVRSTTTRSSTRTVSWSCSSSRSSSLPSSPLLSSSGRSSGSGSTIYGSSTTSRPSLISTSVSRTSSTYGGGLISQMAPLTPSSSASEAHFDSSIMGSRWSPSLGIDNVPTSSNPTTGSTTGTVQSIPRSTDCSWRSLTERASQTTSWFTALDYSIIDSRTSAEITILTIDREDESDDGAGAPPLVDVWSRTPASGASKAIVTTIIGKANGGGRHVRFLTTHFTVGIPEDFVSRTMITSTSGPEQDCHDRQRQLARKKKCWRKTHRYLRRMASSIPCAKLHVQRVAVGGTEKPAFHIKPIGSHDQLTDACMDDLLQRVATLLHTIPCQRMGLTLVEGRGVIIE